MKQTNKFKIIRIIAYIAIIISWIILKYTNLINWTCYINENLGILCPTCGITRAVEGILNFDIPFAIHYNAYCTLVLFPIFFILFVDDIICIILKKRSFVDIIFGD